MVVGQVHEAVNQVWLTHVSGQGTQLLVGGQAATPRGLSHGPLLEDLGLPCQLHCPLLPRTTCMNILHCGLSTRRGERGQEKRLRRASRGGKGKGGQRGGGADSGKQAGQGTGQGRPTH